MGRAPPKKPHASLTLLAFTTDKCIDLFTAPGTAEELLERPVQCKFSSNRLGILISQGNYHTESQYIYLYDLENQSYSGFINMNKILGTDTKKAPTDFVFLNDNTQGAIAVLSWDVIYLLGQKQDDWSLFHKQGDLTNLGPELLQSIKLEQIKPCNNQDDTLFVTLINGTQLLAVASDDIKLKTDMIVIINYVEYFSYHSNTSKISCSVFFPSFDLNTP